MSRSSLVLACALAGCPSDPVVAPVIDSPFNDAEASAFPLDQITLTVAHAGSEIDLASQTFARGEQLVLAGAPYADDLVIHMTGRLGSSEVAYGRTCTFAAAPNVAIPSPHLFFSREVKWAHLAFSPELRLGGAAITYHDGSAIFVGGADASGAAVADVERFDPTTGAFSVLTQVAARTGAVVAPLGTGEFRVALVGGYDPSTGSDAGFVELIEADTNVARRVERIDDAQMAREELTATALSDGRVIAIGGAPRGAMPSGAVEEVSAASGTVMVRTLRAQLAHPRRQHTATRLGDDPGAAVLVAGGVDPAGAPIGPAELFKPLSETFSTTFAATMVAPRTLHQAVRMPDGSVMFVGGVDRLGAPIRQIELFTLDGGFTPQTTTLPPNAGVVDLTATRLPDGRILLAGGRLAPGMPATDTVFIASLDQLSGMVNVVATHHLATPRAQHQATLLCDGTVLLSGGTTTAAPAERYNPPPLGRR